VRGLLGLVERRALSYQTLFGAGIDAMDNTRSGVLINRDTVYRIGAIYAAVRLIADTISTLPVDTFIRQDGQRFAFRPRPRWVDNPEPDVNMTRSDHFQMVMVSLLVDGNAFVRILRDPSGDVVGLRVMDPHRVEVVRGENGRVEYRMDQGRFVVSEVDMIHLTELRRPGELRGVSKVHELKQQFGLAAALEEFAQRFFGSGSTTTGVISVPGEVTAEQARQLVDGWEAGHKGLRRSHRPGVLSGGAKYDKTSVNPNEAQFLESRQYAVEEICRVFRIPPHMLQVIQPGAMSYASVEANAIQFVTYTLRPYIGKIEDAYGRLLPGDAFYRMNIDGLLRGDIGTRFSAYSTGLQAGFLSVNDVRRLEDLRPAEGGDAQRVPLANVNLAAANIQDTRLRVDMAQRLVTTGFDPAAVLAALDLPPIAHTGVPSVQLQGVATLNPEDPAGVYP